MSWEKGSQSECSCPCGQGRIYQEHYSDDWNRSKSSSPIIECINCAAQYHIESFNWHTCDGEYRTIYYCVKNGYPKYEGIQQEGKYTKAYSICDVDCLQFLVENYSRQNLMDVLAILNQCGTYKKIEDKGIGSVARKIIRNYKTFYKTQRISTIASAVSLAIDKYFKFDCRHDTLEKAKNEYNAYVEQKKKDSILINL